MKIILLILFLVTTFSHEHSFTCMFEHYNRDLKNQANTLDVSLYTNSRLLVAPNPVRAPIRIFLDTTNFSTIIPGTNGASTTNLTNLNYLLKSMQVTQTFFQTRLKVGTVGSITSPPSCVDFNPSSQSYSNADLVIYVRYTTDASLGYGATGKSCDYFTDGTNTTTTADFTLQVGRPTFGRIIFNTYKLVDAKTLTNRLFQSITSTSIHQTMHIIGFDSTLYNSYLDPTTGLVYSYTVAPVVAVNANRSATKFMNTPYVKQWARDHYGCASLAGMPLQNQDGSGLGGGSHWQRTAIYDQVMTATSLGTKGFTALTYALLKDMGWYTVDDSFAQLTNYGLNKGCSFVLDACYSATSFSEFCNSASQASNSYCDTTFQGKSICDSQNGLMADNCGIYGQYFDCVDPDSVDTYNYKTYSYEVFGPSSFCVKSNLGKIPLGANLLSRCYPFTCGTSSITFTIGTYSITCLSSQAGVEKTLSALVGSLTCPNFNQYCTNSRKSCTSWCSGSGYCTGGICNCLANFYGKDCTKTTCSASQFYDPSSNSCVASCTPGYYQNIYSRSCEACEAPCSQCVNSPKNCISCQSSLGNIQYYYLGACYTVCPTSTYVSGYTCVACDTTGAFCNSCDVSPTNCTSCQPGKYLSQPGWGTCIAACAGTGYPLQDQVNKICVTNCGNYQIPVGNGSCVLCSSGYYESGSCVTNCSSTNKFADNVTKACLVCHSSCLTCNGAYPQNCTSCPASTYQLYFMCWSKCPRGLYANPTTGKCQLCPSTLNCAACRYNLGTTSPQCTSCAYGNFFQTTGNVCSTSCGVTQYKNTWNNSCNACNGACNTCTGPTNSSCTSCPGIQYLLSNSTGGYCLVTCPTMGYIGVGVICQLCDPTCQTCNGVAANQCATCATSYYFYLGYCRLICPNGTYPNNSTKICDSCHGTCSYCFNNTNTSCTSCSPSLYLFNYTCLSSCPNNMTPNTYNICFQKYFELLLKVVIIISMLMVH